MSVVITQEEHICHYIDLKAVDHLMVGHGSITFNFCSGKRYSLNLDEDKMTKVVQEWMNIHDD